MTGADRSGDRRSSSEPSGVVRATYDWSSKAPATAVVETVAIASDHDPLALESLYGTVDPDALDALVRPNGSHSTDVDTTVSFSYAGMDVRVGTDGTVVVRPDGRPDSK